MSIKGSVEVEATVRMPECAPWLKQRRAPCFCESRILGVSLHRAEILSDF